MNSSKFLYITPIRRLYRYVKQIRILILCCGPLQRNPNKIIPTFFRMFSAWNQGGTLAIKHLLLQLPNELSTQDIWFLYRKTFTPVIEESLKECIGKIQNQDLISILMPVIDTHTTWLFETIDSVISQLYSNWELCVVIADSSHTQCHFKLHKYVKRDNRIRIEFSEHNKSITMATNQALAMANGKFVALLGQNDLLEKQALYRLAESIINEDPDMIYSDEAIMSENGSKIIDYIFRPSFSLELLRSCAYLGHFVAFRTEILKDINGMDTSLENSQDYDLVLRASSKARIIVHIPEILYLSRQQFKNKLQSEVMESSRVILSNYLELCGETAEVRNGVLFNYYEVRYPIGPQHRVAIIIPTKNHGDLVRQCVESIERTVKGVQYSILIIDHASTDPASLEYFRYLSQSHQILRYEGPFNFSSINNWAVKQLSDEYTHYLFCNNDIEATTLGWLDRMIELCQKPDIGIVGAKLLYPGGKVFQHAGVCVGMFGVAEHYAKFMDERLLTDGTFNSGYHGTLIANHEVSAVTAACALMRSDAFHQIGGFDEAIAVGFGDVDLCLRTLEAGYRILFCPHASLIHHESYTRGKSHKDPHPEDTALFSKKWRTFLEQGDPFYNPNLDSYSTKWDVKLPMQFNLHIGRRITQIMPFPITKHYSLGKWKVKSNMIVEKN